MLHKREALCFNDKDEEMFIRGKLLGFCLILYISFMNGGTQQRRKKTVTKTYNAIVLRSVKCFFLVVTSSVTI